MLPFPLSPSRASDFKICPQLFKFRAIDRVPEPPSLPALRGSAVHLALQRLFGLNPQDRSPERAHMLLDGAWAETVVPELPPTLFDGPDRPDLDTERGTAHVYLSNYFSLEDPARLEPAGRELRLQAEVGGLQLVGVLDRLDRTAEGAWVISDYKTGRVPELERSLVAFFAMQVYAVLLQSLFGAVPVRLRLLYLDTPDTYVLETTPHVLETTSRVLQALAKAIGHAMATGDWRPRPGGFCKVCSYRSICPAWAATCDETTRGTPAAAR